MKDNRLIIAAALLLALILLLVIVRYDAPAPQGSDASGFSAARATPILQQLVGSGTPHPTGSPANAIVRDRIVTLLRAYGYDPLIQRAFACGDNGVCADVENILARHSSEGSSRRAVLVAVHYDGVAAGPSASDDGVAVAAVLEIARMLRAERFPNDVIFLIDDGEELGLLGARAFVGQHPWAKDVGAVINLEARGTTGASLMFETNPHNATVVSIAAEALQRPAANSILYTIYKLLPNDTDFTVFKEQPWLGVNFAIIGSPQRYHTPLDSFENASPGSLQHHGDNTLGMIRALATCDLAAPSGADAVYFDLLTLGVVHWPEPWTPVVALLVVLFFGTGIILSKRVSVREVLFGAVATLTMLVVTAVAAYFLLKFINKLGGLPAQWTAEPLPFLVAFWSIPATVVLLLGSLMGKREFAGVWAGVWVVWVLASAGLAFYMPAVSYPLLIPAAAAALVSIAVGSASWRWLVVLLPLSIAAALLFVFTTLLYEGMGAPIMPAIALAVGLVLTGLLPVAIGVPRVWGFAAFGVVIVTVAAGMFMPAVSARVPAPAPLISYQDEEGRQGLLLDIEGEPTAAMVAAGFSRARTQPFSWDADAKPYRAEIAGPPLQAPEFRVSEFARERERLSFRGRLVSRRGAPIAGLVLPSARIQDVAVNGTPVRLRASKSYWRLIRVATMPPEGAEIAVMLKGGQAAAFYAYDTTRGLPPEALAAARSRGAEYVSIGSGDRTMVSVRVDVPQAR